MMIDSTTWKMIWVNVITCLTIENVIGYILTSAVICSFICIRDNKRKIQNMWRY